MSNTSKKVRVFYIPVHGTPAVKFVDPRKFAEELGCEYFEALSISPNLSLFFNENRIGLPPNRHIIETYGYGIEICGPVIVSAADCEGETIDIQDSDIEGLGDILARDMVQRDSFYS